MEAYYSDLILVFEEHKACNYLSNFVKKKRNFPCEFTLASKKNLNSISRVRFIFDKTRVQSILDKSNIF